MAEVTLHDVLENGYYINETSNGQFTGGVYSERWRYKNIDFELVWEGEEVIHWEIYQSPQQKQEEFQKMIEAHKRKGWVIE